MRDKLGKCMGRLGLIGLVLCFQLLFLHGYWAFSVHVCSEHACVCKAFLDDSVAILLLIYSVGVLLL